ncbi:FAD-dependent monooxygenase [Nocardia sp. NBC_01503]|uniref:FAD-dependent monooxygenase n=1 Tax=Nocardia sp. NBC_01503 TaxID=2975997 RepID=UPI002E7BF3F1|nr:FAD-dependent monooxygenase [Nocardia sp. NBC_01503]WTL32574.1 FAD-dependent monooxygenase [Nocardia sp. NBC_01503]
MNNVYHTVSRTEVVIAGAGPTGLMLACELRLAGVDVVLLDTLAERTGQSRAGGIHARTMEIFDQRGMVERLLPHGHVFPGKGPGHFAGIPMVFGDLATRYPTGLAITQANLETQLDRYATELGAPVQWGSPVAGLEQDSDGIEVRIGGTNPRRVRAAYLIGCDGGRSTVRKLAGIGFTGTDATMIGMIADVELSSPPSGWILTRRYGPGDFSVLPLQPGWFRLMVNRHDRVIDPATAPTFDEFRASFREVAGSDYGMHSPRWVSQFGDAARLADRYRCGRVLLAGDAAHIHYPAGGQGLNTGIQDAANLGWKLAAVLRGRTPESLLDTYESERRPVATRVLHNTRAQTALMRPGPHTEALRATLAGLFDIDEVRNRLAAMLFALDIRYDVGHDHPLSGHRVPDADLSLPTGNKRVHQLLRSGRPMLLSLNETRPPTAIEWPERLDLVTAHSQGEHWIVPLLGEIAIPATVLIRPDGHVAWASDDPGTGGLHKAVSTWVDRMGFKQAQNGAAQ